MSTLHAIILGLIEGFTAYLPISSAAHLRIIPALLHWPDPGAAFTAVIQWGTLLSTVVYFWRDLTDLAVGTVTGFRERRPLENPHSRVALGIIVGTIPIGILGLIFKKAVEHQLRSLEVIAWTLIGLAIVLAIAEVAAKHKRSFSQITFKDAVLVGCGQVAALVPGASRSGSTITAGLFLGLKRDAAARFSFLLGLPAFAAAGILELRGALKAHGLHSDMIGPTIIATVVSFISGWLSIVFLLKFLQRRSTLVFILYRIGLGVALLFMIQRGILAPDTGLHAEPAPAVAAAHTR